MAGDDASSSASWMGKKGRKKEFFLEEKHITIEHKLDHQYEGIVVRVIGVEVFHPPRAPYKGFRR